MRRFPRSRRHPHFNTETLAAELGEGYRHFEVLGGRRRPAPDTVNDGWEVEAFRGYADWMATPPFGRGIADLAAFAAEQPTAVMCAEAPWWRCHRRLVADAAVLLHGAEVLHLMPDGRLTPHAPTDGVRRDGDELVYDDAALPL